MSLKVRELGAPGSLHWGLWDRGVARPGPSCGPVISWNRLTLWTLPPRTGCFFMLQQERKRWVCWVKMAREQHGEEHGEEAVIGRMPVTAWALIERCYLGRNRYKAETEGGEWLVSPLQFSTWCLPEGGVPGQNKCW